MGAVPGVSCRTSTGRCVSSAPTSAAAAPATRSRMKAAWWEGGEKDSRNELMRMMFCIFINVWSLFVFVGWELVFDVCWMNENFNQHDSLWLVVKHRLFWHHRSENPYLLQSHPSIARSAWLCWWWGRRRSGCYPSGGWMFHVLEKAADIVRILVFAGRYIVS